MKRLAACVVLALVLLAGVAALAGSRLASTSFYSNAGAIHEPAADARPRSVLWLPATPVPGLPASADEYEPRLSADGARLVFVSGRPGANADLFERRWSPNGWSEPEPIAPINTAADELGPELSRDGQRLYFYSDREGSIGGYDIFVSHLLDGTWGAPVNLGERVNSAANDYGPALAPDGRRLFFASNRARPGEAPRDDAWSATIRERRNRHDYDLFLADLEADAAPTRLDALDTTADEGAPALSPAGDFLYFASDRQGTLGGFDLFRSRLRDGLPGPPLALDASINSSSNDLDPALSAEGFRLYFSSDRPRETPPATGAPSAAPAADGSSAARTTPTSSGEQAQPPTPATYSLWTSASREVFLDRRPLSLGAALAQFWERSWPWILALALTLAALLAALLLARHPDLRDRYSKLGLLARCLVASLLIHMLLLSLLAFWRVGSALGDALASNSAGGGHRVSIASAADSGIAGQIMGSIVDAAPEAPLTSDPRSSALTSLRPLESSPVSLSIARAAPAPAVVTLAAPEAEPIAEPRAESPLAAPLAPTEHLPAPSAPAAPSAESSHAPPMLEAGTADAADLPSRQLSAPSSSAPVAMERADAPPVAFVATDPSVRLPSAAAPALASAILAGAPSAQPALPPAPTQAATMSEGVPTTPLAPEPRAGPAGLEGAISSRSTPSSPSFPALPAMSSAVPPVAAPATEVLPPSPTAGPSVAVAPGSSIALGARLPASRPVVPSGGEPSEHVVLAPLGNDTAAPAPSTRHLAGPSPATGLRIPSSTATSNLPIQAPVPAEATPPDSPSDPTGHAIVSPSPQDATLGARLPDAPAATPTDVASAKDRAPAAAPLGGTPAMPASPLALGRAPASGTTMPSIRASDMRAPAAVSGGPAEAPTTSAPMPVGSFASAPPAAALSSARIPGLEPDPPAPTTADLALRDPTLRDQVLESAGGSKETERAVVLALDWLARHQARDGRFSGQHFDDACGQCNAPAEVRSDVAMTGLSLLSFLGAGHIHTADGPHRDHVARALSWLIAGQDNAGDLRRGETLYSQSVAAVALCEAFAMSRDARIGEAARRAIRFLDDRSSRPSNDPADTAVLGWQLMAVHSARRCGFLTSWLTIDRARQWLAQVDQGDGRSAYTRTGPASPAATAEAMVVRQLLGHRRDEPAMQASARFILTQPPAWNGGAPTYYWYYATLALFQQQGDAWTTWNERLAAELLEGQRRDGAAAGSWDPKDQWSRLGGRIYQTAVCTLSLEVYYRYKPVGLDLLAEPREPEPR